MWRIVVSVGVLALLVAGVVGAGLLTEGGGDDAPAHTLPASPAGPDHFLFFFLFLSAESLRDVGFGYGTSFVKRNCSNQLATLN